MTAVQSGSRRPRRRQARGERRMAQLLDAAARVFCKVGYTAASTNAIAREAGVSPGTLYQFFPNKDAIGDALSERLVVELSRVHNAALSLDHAHLTLAETLDQALDPMIDFNLSNPVCFTLLQATDLPQRLDEDHDVLEAAMLGKVKMIIADRAPHLDAKAIDRCADTCWGAFYGVMHQVFQRPEEDQRALVGELKKLLYGYLAPIMGEDAPDSRA